MGAYRITSDQETHYWTMRAKGMSIVRAATEAGFSESYGKKLERKPRNGNEYRSIRTPKAIPDYPVPADKWPDDAQEALADRTGFLFCKRYMGLELSRWQRYGWERMEEAWESPDRSFICENAAPGSGKSTKGVGFACKLIVLDRRVRTLFISRAQALAERNTVRVKNLLERTAPPLEGESTLAADFGRFKPRMGGDVWRRDKQTVEQLDGQPVDEKEPTVSAFGFDSEWLGYRVDFVFGDDLDSTRGIRNMDIIEGRRDVFDNELEARLEPGGLFMVDQQRLGPGDFSSHVLAKRILPYFDGSDDAEVEGEMQYEHIVFKAHYEELCRGRETHRTDAPSWPDGCLLDNRRLPWQDLRKIMNNPTKKRTFSVVYQQQEQDPEDVLVQRIWVDGGKGHDGIDYIGCWDNDRAICEPPKDLAAGTFSVMSIDPSPTKFWGVSWWLFHFASEQRYLMDLWRGKMEAPDLLYWTPDMGFTGMAEDFYQRSVKAGYPLQVLAMERNAAQRWIFQYPFAHNWSSQRGVLLASHDTSTNKHDPDYGVQMLGPLYKFGRVRLPAKGQDARLASLKLVEEVTRYPAVSFTTDCLMSQWFAELAALKQVVSEDEGAPLWTPSWLSRSPSFAGYL